MPPRRKNQLPPPVEPDLPALDQASQTSINNSLADVDASYVPAMDDASLDVAPEDVVNDVAAQPEVRRGEANVVPTGVAMDLGFFNQLNSAQSQEQFNQMYDGLPDVQKHVYDRSFGQKVTPAWAAQKADEFFKTQDDRTKAAEDPMKQAQLEERRAKLQERKSVQTDFKIRRDNTIKNIEEILKDESYASLVGPIDGTVGGVYDAAFNEKAQAKRAKLDRLVNFDVLDMTKYLRPISQDELKYLRTLVPGQTQNWEVYKQYLGEKLEMLKATDKAAFNPATSLPLAADDAPASTQPAAAAPSAAQGRNTFTTPDGYTYRRMPDGSAELVE